MIKRITLVVIFLFFLTPILPAQEIKGLWAGAFEAEDVTAAIGLNLDDSKIILRFGGRELKGALKDLQIKDGEISFIAELQPKAEFKGKLEEGKISGTLRQIRNDGSTGNTGVWTVRKVDSLDFKDDSKPDFSNIKSELPPPTGKFAIGRKFFYWTDESRLETITETPDDKRKMFVQLWYPTKNKAQPSAEYIPNFEELFGKIEGQAYARNIKIHAVQDAKPINSKFPVIIFSPGLGSNPANYTAMIENLVSNGYVVATINHPYDTENFKFADGDFINFAKDKWDKPVSKDWTNEQRKQFFDERRFGWAKDISFVVNQLQKLDKPFKDIFDWQKLGHFGHSFGGQASSIVCANDLRFKACANLDGMAQGNVVLPNEKGEMMKQPFLFFSKSEEVTDAELKMMNLSREEYRLRENKRITERWKPSFKNAMANIESGSYLIIYPGIKHGTFGDGVLFNKNDKLFLERDSIVRNINDYTLAFFDKFLRNKKNTLLDGKEPRQPIMVEFLRKSK